LISAMAADGIEVIGDEVRPGENYRDPDSKTATTPQANPKVRSLPRKRSSQPAIGIGDIVDFQENKEKNELLKIINEEIDKILG